MPRTTNERKIASALAKPHVKRPEADRVTHTSKFGVQIFTHMNALGRTILAVAKDNAPVNLGELFLWETIYKFAEKRRKALWDATTEQGMIVTDGLTSGDHELYAGAKYTITAEVSNPVKRFSADKMIELLLKDTKLNEVQARGLIAKAKIGDKGSVTKKIVERS